MVRDPFTIGGVEIKAGAKREIGLPIARLVTGAEVTLPVLAVHGRASGPSVWLDAAIHGDEVGGVEIIRRVLQDITAKDLRGTLIAVPIVNVHGFMNGDRYLPDRRDLNRSFPGTPRGSMAGRIAHLMMTEVVQRCEVGIDLHTGSDHRTNLPQIRADLDDSRTRELAETFGAPVMIHARTRDGSLRHAAREHGATVLLYEGGEALRFDEQAIDAGVKGCLRVMGAAGMIAEPPRKPDQLQTSLSTASSWVRAPEGGILHTIRRTGDRVGQKEVIGVVADPLGVQSTPVVSEDDGVIVGRTNLPIVNRGDALFHIAWSNEMQAGPSKADASAEPVLDEDEII